MAGIDDFSFSTGIIATVVIFFSIIYYFMKNRNILPGPRGWPFFGLYLSLKDDTSHLQLQQFGKKYGDLYSFTFVGKLYINLGSVKAVRELHVNKSECFAGRFADFSFVTPVLQEGVVLANGEPWKVRRKYFVESFKKFGLTVMKDNTTGPLYDTLSHTIEDFRRRKGEAFNVMPTLVTRCMGTVRQVLFGEDGVSDEALLKMNDAFAAMFESIIGPKSLLTGNFGRFILLLSPALRKALPQHIVLNDLLIQAVKKIESTMDENNPTCIVEDYYKERNIRKLKNDPSWKHFSDNALIASLAQFIGDGIMSVAYFISGLLNALVENPEEQDKIYKELMDVVGPSRLPDIEDKNKLPYTTAFMNEVLRVSNFFPFFPSLECTRETTVRGYKIPKGSITILNFWQAHHDPETYENPDSFDPSRYLTSPGKPRAELPVYFGLGKRACPGEPFVTTKCFLFLTSIVKNFTISKPANSTNKSDSLFLMTNNMELCIKPRTEK